MNRPKTIKWEDFLARQLQDLEFASEYLWASWEEEGLIGLQRSIENIIQAHHLPGDLSVNPLENLDKLVPLSLNTQIVDRLKAEVARQQPLPQTA
jgi:hypothetical protein